MMAQFNGIDISRWQKEINYDFLSKGIDFAIIKAGGSDAGFYTDSMFLTHYKELHEKRRVPCGTYYFVGKNFYGESAGIADAHRFINIIKGKKFEYPVCLDIETTDPARKEDATNASIAFCKELEKAGYYAMIYASDISGFKDKLNVDRLTAFDKWVARYGSKPKYVKDFGIWQASSAGYVDGIPGKVDIDYAYKDYESIMIRAHLNGY